MEGSTGTEGTTGAAKAEMRITCQHTRTKTSERNPESYVPPEARTSMREKKAWERIVGELEGWGIEECERVVGCVVETRGEGR